MEGVVPLKKLLVIKVKRTRRPSAYREWSQEDGVDETRFP
jgi:hypothetical protein